MTGIQYHIEFRGHARSGEEAFVLMFEVSAFKPDELGPSGDPNAECHWQPLMIHANAAWLGPDGFYVQVYRDFYKVEPGSAPHASFSRLFGYEAMNELWVDGEALTDKGVEVSIEAVQALIAAGIVFTTDDEYPWVYLLGNSAGVNP